MGCNCSEKKKYTDINHVRILATQMASIEKEDYVLYKTYWPNNTICYNFAPLANFKGEAVEVVHPLQGDTDIKTSKSNRDTRKKASAKAKKL